MLDRRRWTSLVFSILALGAMVTASACDTDPLDPNNTNNQNTDNKCDYSFADTGAGKAIGESCTSGSECRYGVCIAGDSSTGQRANLVSQSFGYCTRGCDCGTDATRLTDAEKTSGLHCLYPPGNQGRWRHVVLKCNSASDCTAVDPNWNDCAFPGTGVTDLCME